MPKQGKPKKNNENHRPTRKLRLTYAWAVLQNNTKLMARAAVPN